MNESWSSFSQTKGLERLTHSKLRIQVLEELAGIIGGLQQNKRS